MLGVLASAGAAVGTFRPPHLDYFALAPEIVLSGVIVLILLVDLFVDETRKYLVSSIAGIGVIAAAVPVVALALAGGTRSMVGGAYVVDDFALLMKGLFLASGYVVLLMAERYIEDGDYYQGEFSFLLLSSLLGMVVMASARDLITIFVALELLSIPAYLLAGWRKRDLRSNEAALKYYLLGVLSSAVMLYGMSLLFGVTGSTVLHTIRTRLATGTVDEGVVTIGIFFIIVGFAFKVSAVPFHFWAPDTYEGAPTPVTAFLSVASKTAGFVALFQLIYVAFIGRAGVWAPLFWGLSAITMTVGNLIALRQTNIVRLLGYSSIAQAGYILVPFAVAGNSPQTTGSAQTSAIVYLLIYAAMNLGAFAVVMAVARKTRSGEISSFGGLFEYAPGLTVLMTVFLVSLAGVPPVGGWYAKLSVFLTAVEGGTPASIILAVILGVNSVIAAYYYLNIAREMWMRPVPDGDRTRVRVPPPLGAALGLTAAVTVALGIVPSLFARLADLSHLAR